MKITASSLTPSPLRPIQTSTTSTASSSPAASAMAQDRSSLSIQSKQGLFEMGAGVLMSGALIGTSTLLLKSMGQASSGNLAGALIGGGAAAIVTGVTLGTVTDGKMLANTSAVALGGALGGAALGYMSSQSLSGAATGALMGAGVAGLGAYLGK